MSCAPLRRFCLAAFFLATFCLPAIAGTKVRIATTIGNIDLELYDQDKPVTVANFLSYIKSGRYSGTFLHRLVPGFIVQGGGYGLATSATGYTVAGVTAYAPIVNEYAVGKTCSNTYGTIAMAKLPAEDDEGNPVEGGGPDSATSEWFLNLADNSTNLDSQNGGFTVFGKVIAGFDVLAAFNITFVNQSTGGKGVYDASSNLGSSAFTNLPLLANALQYGNLVFSEVTILPNSPIEALLPSITIKGGATLKVKSSTAKISGLGSANVVKVEWRLGSKGKFRQHAAGGSWKLRVNGLKMGKNVVVVRGVSATGIRGAQKKLRIVRQ